MPFSMYRKNHTLYDKRHLKKYGTSVKRFKINLCLLHVRKRAGSKPQRSMNFNRAVLIIDEKRYE